jgi:hypothetical protein
MSIMKAKWGEETPKVNVKKMVLPAYIVLSALFIWYAAYSFFTWVVYNSGVNQWATAGQKQGYEQAIVDLMNQAGTKCEPVALTMWEAQVDVINVACLQQAAPESSSDVMEEGK